MKTKLIVLLILFFSIEGYSQSIYEEALILDRYIKNNELSFDDITNDEIAKIEQSKSGKTADQIIAIEDLKSQKRKIAKDSVLSVFVNHRLLDQTDVENKTKIEEGLSKNPFLQNIKVSGSQQEQGAEAFSKLFSGGIASSIGGLDVTTIADGLAMFIVKRTKQELSVAFFERFQDELENTPDLKTFFPQTYRTLTLIDEEVYMFEAYLQTLRECFEKDLRKLPDNLPFIIDNHKDFFLRFPELAATLRSGCYVAGELQNKVHPGDILKHYPTDYLDSLNKNWKASIQLLQLISESLRNSCDNCSDYWISKEQIKNLVNNETLFKIYLGLIYEHAKTEYKSIPFENITLVTILDSVSRHFDDSYLAYKNYFLRFAEKSSKINTLIRNFEKPVNDSIAIGYYNTYFDAAIDMLSYCTEVKELIPSAIKKDKNYGYLQNFKDSLKDYFDVVHSASDLVLDVKKRNYASAIVNTAHIYSLVIEKYADSLKDEIKSYSEKTFSQFLKYGTFMSMIVQAKTSDEVEAAIEAIALPSGSARIKRESEFNVALNAYCGGFVGQEKIKGINNWEWNSYGVAAPVGISVSRGATNWIPVIGMFADAHKVRGKWIGHHWSQSLFLSVVDVGALAAFRFNSANDSVQAVPEIQLEDIVSPGIFYSLGIPKCPISINAGWQVGPLLRKVTATQNSYAQMYSRFSVSLCVDIPLLNFYTKPKD